MVTQFDKTNEWIASVVTKARLASVNGERIRVNARPESGVNAPAAEVDRSALVKDRHRPGYMAAYMREYRKRTKT